LTVRDIFLAGTYPCKDREESQNWALTEFSPNIRRIGDGETGSRSSWIVGLKSRLAMSPDLELEREGNWTNYYDTPRFRPTSGLVDPSGLDLGYAHDAILANEALQRLLADRRLAGIPLQGLDNISLQVGIPGPPDVAAFYLMGLPRLKDLPGWLRGFRAFLRHEQAFRAATAREITRVASEVSPSPVFSIEIPFETVLAVKFDGMPALVRRWLHGKITAEINRLVLATPLGTRFGLHLCTGDLDGIPLERPKTARPISELAAALVAAWPQGYPLEFVHFPLCDGQDPPHIHDEFYESLKLLQGIEPEIIAGLVHPSATLPQQKFTLRIVEEKVGKPVGVAMWCGCGRLSADLRDKVAQRHRDLSSA
jgi:hypothetical protein